MIIGAFNSIVLVGRKPSIDLDENPGPMAGSRTGDSESLSGLREGSLSGFNADYCHCYDPRIQHMHVSADGGDLCRGKFRFPTHSFADF